MKKLIALFMAFVMMTVLCACGRGITQEKKLHGMLNSAVFGENNTGRVLDDHLVKEHSMDTSNSPDQFVYYDNMTGMIMALNKGEISCMSVPKSVADYLALQNEDFFQKDGNISIPEQYAMAVMKENKEIYQILNDTIKEIVADGTIDALVEEHINKVVKGTEPEKIDLPEFDGAATIKVAVTGDLPPMDYVDVNGDPAGFNLALLAEISRRAEVNIEVAVVENSARPTALVSGRVDAIFWNRVWYCPVSGCESAEITEAPEDVLCTETYYSDFYVPVILKPSAE